MPTSQPSPSQLSPTFNTLLNHLLSLIDYVQQENPESATSLLLISKPDITCVLSPLIQQSFHDLHICTLTTDNFLKADFDHRYSLGCFIDAQLLAAETAAFQRQQQLVATRLRDLFAQQSVIFLVKSSRLETAVESDSQQATTLNKTDKLNKASPNYKNNVCSNNLTPLGYLATPISEAGEQAATNISCWQFNLYDYKARPDWLNAKYWANPENFDKYRW